LLVFSFPEIFFLLFPKICLCVFNFEFVFENYFGTYVALLFIYLTWFFYAIRISI